MLFCISHASVTLHQIGTILRKHFHSSHTARHIGGDFPPTHNSRNKDYFVTLITYLGKLPKNLPFFNPTTKPILQLQLDATLVYENDGKIVA